MNQKLSLSSIIRKAHLQQRCVKLIGDRNESNRQKANLSMTIVTVKNDLTNGQSIRTPLEVHEVNGKYLLVDGYHRYQGALDYCKSVKIDPNTYQVPVNITKSNYDATVTASFKVNLNHGVGHTASELKQLYFRKYTWDRFVPTISEIMSDTGCSRGTASNIATAAKWCIERIKCSESEGLGEITTVEELKNTMIYNMTHLGIDPTNLDEYGLPSYSLLFKEI
jgi:hypothetical protein